MTNVIKTSFFVLFFLNFLTVKAQNHISEGYVSYIAEYDLPADQQMVAAMLPKEYKIYFKNEISKFVIDMGMMKSQVISNEKTDYGLMLMEIPMADQKVAVKLTPEDKAKQKEELGDFEISKTKQTKVISGYNATKYTVKEKKSATDMEIWATTDLKIPLNSFTESFQGIEGTLLEFSTNMNGLKIKMLFKEVKQESVENMDMTIPVGFKEMTMQQFMSMTGQ